MSCDVAKLNAMDRMKKRSVLLYVRPGGIWWPQDATVKSKHEICKKLFWVRCENYVKSAHR